MKRTLLLIGFGVIVAGAGLWSVKVRAEPGDGFSGGGESADRAASHGGNDRNSGGRADWNDAGRGVDKRERDQTARETQDVELTQKEAEQIRDAEDRTAHGFGPPEKYGGGGEALPDKEARPK